MQKLVDWLPNAWAIFTWLFPTTVAAITGWLTHLDQPAYLVIFYASGVFGFLSAGLYAIDRFWRENTVFERLVVAGSTPILVNPNRSLNTAGILLKYELENTSDRKIYARLKRGHVELQRSVNPDAEINEAVFVMPPKTKQAVQIHAIPALDVAIPITGRSELEVVYGPKSDKLCYTMIYRTAPAIEVQYITDSTAQITFVAPVVKYEHDRSFLMI